MRSRICPCCLARIRVVTATAIMFFGGLPFTTSADLALPKERSTNPPVTLGPYISWIDTRSPTVMLHTSDSLHVKLRIETSGNGTEIGSSGHHHRLRVPEEFVAAPGILEYSLLLRDKTMGPFLLKVPDRNAGTVSFAAVGDAQNSRSSERRRAILAAAAAHNPDFIIHTGDLHAGKGGKADGDDIFGDDWRINYFEPMPPIQATVPFFPVFGNHDDEISGQRETFMRAFPDWPENGCYSFALGETAFFFLDMQQQVGEFFRKRQDEWLKNAVGRHPGAKWRIAVFHVSPWSGGHRGEREWTIRQREKMLYVLQELGINLVFCGHDHNYQRMKPLSVRGSNGTPVHVVITGLAGANFYDAQERDYTSKVVNRRDHYCLVKAGLETLDLTVFAVDGEVLDAFSIPCGDTQIFHVSQEDDDIRPHPSKPGGSASDQETQP